MRKSFTKNLHLVVQVNTNPILYFSGILTCTSLFNMSKLKTYIHLIKLSDLLLLLLLFS